MSDLLLSGEQIRQYLTEVAAAMPPTGPQATIIVVGGSLLAVHGLRGGTRDVDSIRRLNEAIARAVTEVAARHTLAPRWLNDNASMFYPQGLREDQCQTILEHPRLLVLGAPLRYVFVMKLYRGEAPDWDDMIAMWPHCGFSSASEAVALFWECYPHAREDEFLIDSVREIAADSAS